MTGLREVSLAGFAEAFKDTLVRVAIMVASKGSSGGQGTEARTDIFIYMEV